MKSLLLIKDCFKAVKEIMSPELSRSNMCFLYAFYCLCLSAILLVIVKWTETVKTRQQSKQRANDVTVDSQLN